MIQLINNTVIGNELALVWGDGSECYIPLETLRKHCPCAACQGEPDTMGYVVKPAVAHTDLSFQLVSIQHVGGYALQLKWADGHSSGIYSYELLQSLA
ncbi:MAG TPA: hypothetical protein DEP88_06460 [Verrucomicrobiales bacterium]|nr:hypothetical protein [Verrucomicrobiales bacterium]